jgi:hypothetical protein
VPHDIEFPDIEPRFVFDRDCLAFTARVGGHSVECLVTAEMLMTHFGAQEPSEEEMRAAYREHRAEIQSIARDHIQNGWVDESRLFLTTRFTRLKVTFGDRLDERPDLRAMADAAHRILVEIIGPNAKTVEVLWDTETVRSDPQVLILRITDPLLPHTQKFKIYPGAKWKEDPLKLHLEVGMSWGRILRMRAQELTIQSG